MIAMSDCYSYFARDYSAVLVTVAATVSHQNVKTSTAAVSKSLALPPHPAWSPQAGAATIRATAVMATAPPRIAPRIAAA